MCTMRISYFFLGRIGRDVAASTDLSFRRTVLRIEPFHGSYDRDDMLNGGMVITAGVFCYQSRLHGCGRKSPRFV